MADSLKKHFLDWLKVNADENQSVNPTLQSETSTKKDVQTQSDIAYEDGDLKLIVQKGIHKKQKNFRLQDHLFYFKIEQKSSSQPPLLINILDFLNAAFVHVLDSIKTFYEKDHRNIAYLTIYQVNFIKLFEDFMKSF